MIFILKHWKLVLTVFFCALIGLFVWHYKSTVEENKRLTTQIQSANGTIDKLGKRFDMENDINVQSNNVKKALKGKEDGAVAPVLDTSIDAIDGLR
jgi:hypothetical protein